jgi:hypothetical protein
MHGNYSVGMGKKTLHSKCSLLWAHSVNSTDWQYHMSRLVHFINQSHIAKYARVASVVDGVNGPLILKCDYPATRTSSRVEKFILIANKPATRAVVCRHHRDLKAFHLFVVAFIHLHYFLVFYFFLSFVVMFNLSVAYYFAATL